MIKHASRMFKNLFILVICFTLLIPGVASASSNEPANSEPQLASIQIKGVLSYPNKTELRAICKFVKYEGEFPCPVNWRKIDENNVISLSSSGEVTFMRNSGTAVIIAEIGNVSDSLKVTVSSTYTISSTLSYSKTPVQLKLIETFSDGFSKEIENAVWTTSNSSVATVNNGWVTFSGNSGPVTITASIDKSGNTISKSVSTFVSEQSSYQSIKIDQSNLHYLTKPNPIQLTVSGVFQNGSSERITSGVTWEVTNPSNGAVATVNDGLVTFTGINGTAMIRAKYNGHSASVSATLNAPKTLVSLIINNNNQLNYSPNPITLSVRGQYSDGTTTSVANNTVSWSSSNTNVATVSNTGIVTFTGRNGSVTITGRSGNVSGSVSATVNITANSLDIEPARRPFEYSSSPVQLRAKDGNTYLNNVTWTSSDTSIATVSTSGVVTFTGKNGTVTIYATYGDKTASISTTVSQTISNITIKGTLAYSKNPVRLSAEVTWPDGRKQTISTADWSSSDTSIATVSNTGVVTFTGKNGPLTITVRYADRSDSVYTNVVNDTAISDLRIDQGLFYSSTPITLTLTAVLANGKTQKINGSNATWTSSDTYIASVNNNGVVTYTGRNGWVTITAVYDGKSTSRSAYIDSSFQISSLKINETLAYSTSPVYLTLTATLPNGQTQSISASDAVWTSSDLSIAEVNANGVVTFKGKNGPVTITASYGNRTASVYVNVNTSTAINSLKINETLNYSQYSTILTLTATLVNGTTQNVPASSAVWTSSDTTIATVNNGVVYFTGKNGYVSITATYSGKSASVYTTVNTSTGSPNQPFNNKIINNTGIETKILNKIRTTPALSSIQNYADAEKHWANKQIKIAKKLELVSGYSDGTFKPNKNVTRAEFVIMISRIFDIPAATYNTTGLKDISNHYAKNYIISLNNLGLVGGYPDQTFKPDAEITRAEVVTILTKLIDFNQVKNTSSAQFTDIKGHWAASNINRIAAIGVLSGRGDGRFAPKDNTTRAEAVSLLLRTLSLNNNIKNALDNL